MSARSLPDLLAWLDGHWNMEARSAGVPPGGSAARPSLERMRALMAVAGDPQHAAPVVHLTGTNGKTSTARIVASLLSSAGLAVGTTTSPHLERVNERITGPPIMPRRRERDRRRLEPIPDQDLADQLLALQHLETLVEQRPSWFELVTAAAFLWFADVAVDVAVVEVGLGGRWDSTNVADGRVAVVTNVSLDHVEYLGPTVADIATEKAGIIKPGSTVVVGETDPTLVAIFERAASEAGADAVWLAGRDFDAEGNDVSAGGRYLDVRTPSGVFHELELPLFGRHQGRNAALAVAAVEAFFGGPLSSDVVAEGLSRVTSPGRLEVLGREPLVLLDGAHNTGGMLALARALDEDFGGAGPVVAVMGVLEGHDPGEFLDALGTHRLRLVVACPAPSPRSVDPEAVAAAARERGVEAVVVPSVGEAVEAAGADAAADEVVLVTGSLYVVGAARAALGAAT